LRAKLSKTHKTIIQLCPFKQLGNLEYISDVLVGVIVHGKDLFVDTASKYGPTMQRFALNGL